MEFTSEEYRNTLARLYELQKFGIKLGLNSTSNLLARLGDPHHRVPCLHIAGTNGKGSVAAMCQAALLRAGVRVGMYLSPHLVRFTERFLINGREIGPQRVVDLADKVWAVVDPAEPPTFFEVVTAMAFLLFAEEEVELAILETGLGGRLDATNVCRPRVSVITNIGLEHQQYLGNRLSDIAFEKAGIIKPGVPLVHGVMQPVARKVVEQRARELKAPMLRRGQELRFRRGAGESFSLSGSRWQMKDLRTSLVGRHQAENACLALGALELLAAQGLPVEPEHFRQGLMEVQWPGRLQRLPRSQGKPALWLDGAHNLPAIRALLDNLDLVRASGEPLVMVIGIMGDKELAPMVRALAGAADRVVFSRPVYERAADPEDLAALAPEGCRFEVVENLGAAITRAEELAGSRGAVLITGSLFTVGEALELLER